jgi:hypothetical protein
MTEVKTRARSCDYCKADLTQTEKSYGWHYVLSGEFTPSRSMVGYDPHPVPPRDTHFCDKECLARWIGATQGDVITYEMFDAGGKVLAATGSFGSIGNYSEQRKLAMEVFKAMYAARGTSVGADQT